VAVTTSQSSPPSTSTPSIWNQDLKPGYLTKLDGLSGTKTSKTHSLQNLSQKCRAKNQCSTLSQTKSSLSTKISSDYHTPRSCSKMREIQIGTNIRVCDCQFICFLNKHIHKMTRGLEIFKITFKFRFDCCKIIIKIIVCFVVTRLNDLYYWEI
jgi:hypothetical protein